jgi:tungstate transport system ATP-binding protein
MVGPFDLYRQPGANLDPAERCPKLNPVLEILDLEVWRSEKLAVKVEHLSVNKGDVLAIIGPNGAGKSSLLLAIARLLKPNQGTIRFNGFGLDKRADVKYRRHLGLVLQDPLLVDASVASNVAMGLRFRRISREEIRIRTDKWLERFGITHLRDRSACNLSGGEAQRVSLARAFVLQPNLLLLDEPFSALDAPTRINLLEDLNRILAETGTTTIFISHDLSEASRLANRMAILLDGMLRQQGTPEEIYADPVGDDVRAFLGLTGTNENNSIHRR